MSNTGHHGMRRFFEGTGAYIALFLVVTALAVAGYWTLIPHPVKKADIPAPTPQTEPRAVEPETRREAEKAPMPERRLASAPVQGTAKIVLPEPTESVAPEAPVLVVEPLSGETVAPFSMDELQYSETMGDWRTHDGVDIASDVGTPVCAASSGTVLDVRDDDLMGTTVVLSHDGGFDTIYANLQSTPTVEIGDYVTAGQVIGSVGRTALSESAEPTHLHFGVTKDGEFVDPETYLKGK